VLSDGLSCDFGELVILEVEQRALLGFAEVLVEFCLDLLDGRVLRVITTTTDLIEANILLLLGEGSKFDVFGSCLEGFKPRSL
jgi:hypothetical protein